MENTQKSSPLDATHTIELVIVRQGEPGAFLLTEIDKTPYTAALAGEAQLECPLCGAQIKVPEGNLRNYARKLSQELGEGVYGKLRYGHLYNEPQPKGTSKALRQQHRMSPKASTVNQPRTKKE